MNCSSFLPPHGVGDGLGEDIGIILNRTIQQGNPFAGRSILRATGTVVEETAEYVTLELGNGRKRRIRLTDIIRRKTLTDDDDLSSKISSQNLLFCALIATGIMRPIRAFYNGLVGGLAVGVLLGVQIMGYYLANVLNHYGYNTHELSNYQLILWLITTAIRTNRE